MPQTGAVQGSLINRILQTRWIAESIAVLAAVVYGFQSFIYIHQIIPTLDESNYLFKGYLFAKGIYFPYQEYGPLTNKMPLSFLIPGWIQALFGPGLRTGRIFAVLLGVLMLLGLWLVARRLSTRWWAAVVVWAVALNPILVKMYAQALSEGLVAFMLPWVLVFILGELPSNRTGRLKYWRTTLGAVLLGIVVATRQNMVVAVPFILLYIFWEHGRKAGWLAAAGCTVPLLLVHILFWPNIMQVWLIWIPRGILPYLDSLRPVMNGTAVWLPDSGLLSRLSAFWIGIRHHFIALVGALCALILWPKKEDWKTSSHFRAAVLLFVLLVVLVVAHGAAVFGKDYCLFCFSIYISFFSEIGTLFAVVTFSAWNKKPGVLRQVLAFGSTVIIAAGTAYGGKPDLNPVLLNLQVPRLRNFQILPGNTELWRLLVNKYNVTYGFLQETVSLAAGLLVGLLIVTGVLGYAWVTRRRTRQWMPGYLVLVILAGLGLALSPTLVLGGGDPDPACGDIIASYEIAGEQLAHQVPPGSLVYWNGGLVVAPLLYMPGIRIFPPQLNDGYSRRMGGDAQQLYRFGYWNDSLAEEWLHQADFVLVEGWRYHGEMVNQISPAEFNELPATPSILPCKDGTQIRVYRREP
jgi:hypothetical protein